MSACIGKIVNDDCLPIVFINRIQNGHQILLDIANDFIP